MSDRSIAAVAAQQRGVVTTTQLHAAGFSDTAIRRRVVAGRLHRLFHGVYLVGHTAAPELAVELAATLACGEASLLSHRTAAGCGRSLRVGPGRSRSR